jgi:hypothetical protein
MTDHDPTPDALPDPGTIPAPLLPDRSDETPEPASSISDPATTRRRSPVALIGIVGFLLLAGGEVWLFTQIHRNDEAHALSAQSARIAGIDQRIDRLKSRMTTLETKVSDLAQTQTAQAPTPTPTTPPPPAAPSVPPALAKQLTAMQASIAALSTTTLADHATMAELQSKAADLPKLVARAQTLALLAEASLALQNGDPLGTIPNAPEALTRYATTKPPTLGALKAAFPAYAGKAERAGGDVVPHGGFWRNVKGHIESLVTIRHHNDVLVGSRAAGILGQAQADLDQDDLAAALAALKLLPPAAQGEMAQWTQQASRLLAARAALADMAEHN